MLVPASHMPKSTVFFTLHVKWENPFGFFSWLFLTKWNMKKKKGQSCCVTVINLQLDKLWNHLGDSLWTRTESHAAQASALTLGYTLPLVFSFLTKMALPKFMGGCEDYNNIQTNVSTFYMCFYAESCLVVDWSGHLYQELPSMFKTSHKIPTKWSQSILYHEVCVTSKVLVGFSKWEQRFRAHTGHTRGTLGAPLGTGSCIALRLTPLAFCDAVYIFPL